MGSFERRRRRIKPVSTERLTVLVRMKSLVLLLGLLLVSGPLVSAWWGDNDSDGDGIKDAEDDDDDNDGLLDVNDEDDDGDGILDEDEDSTEMVRPTQRMTTTTVTVSWTAMRTMMATVLKMMKTLMMTATASWTRMTSCKSFFPATFT